MSRKDTVWGARHKAEDEEIKRIIDRVYNDFNVSITKLEASYILAQRSQSVIFSKEKLMKWLKESRGIYE